MGKFNQILRKAQQFAEKNPDKISKVADKAGSFVNKQTKGKYADKVDGVLNKVDSFTGNERDRGPQPGAAGTGSAAGSADGPRADGPSAGPDGGWQVDRESDNGDGSRDGRGTPA
ncbi:MAG: antitoxin [Cumulibacter sp.]